MPVPTRMPGHGWQLLMPARMAGHGSRLPRTGVVAIVAGICCHRVANAFAEAFLYKCRNRTMLRVGLQGVWLAEAIRLQEEQSGPADDATINRELRQKSAPLTDLIIARAEQLAMRDGQFASLRRLRKAATGMLVVLALLAAASGFILAGAALGDGQTPVNLFWALGTLLGLNLFALLLWLLLSLGAGGGWSLGRMPLWAGSRLVRDAHALPLTHVLLPLLQSRQLARWVFGGVSHLLWLLLLTSALVGLALLLSIRRYGFVWETTLLSSDSFVQAITLLGALPAQLGFALPDAATIQASGEQALADERSRQAWASWLFGQVVVYGVLPRVVLLLVCVTLGMRGLRYLQPDLQLPYYQALAAQLQPSSRRLGVVDADTVAPWQAPRSTTPGTTAGVLLTALELDPAQHAWPPAGVAQALPVTGVIDDRFQRQQLLDRVSRQPPTRLLVACDPQRSPDRGSIGLLAELAQHTKALRVWLLPTATGVDPERLASWHRALSQHELQIAGDNPLQWLEHGDA